jgi:hypothetical protein
MDTKRIKSNVVFISLMSISADDFRGCINKLDAATYKISNPLNAQDMIVHEHSKEHSFRVVLNYHKNIRQIE